MLAGGDVRGSVADEGGGVYLKVMETTSETRTQSMEMMT